ncbi:MAG: DedA family protein [Alphaproteobacteria bacterium]|nr:DedA family protein [Alphaproteobacteria bacterium]
MNGLNHHIIAYIAAHPDWAILVVGVSAFGESLAIVSLFFPGTAVLIAAGALVQAGALDPVSVVFAASFGAISGDAISYWIGQRFGAVIPRMWPFRIRPGIIAGGIAFFRRYGWASVFIGRFFGPVRAVVPLIAGMMAMPVRPFYVANCLSAIVWAPALLLSGILLGGTLSTGWTIEDRLFVIALAIAFLAVLGYWLRRFFHVS